ncbi:MAG TPA: FtsH protease activity modulator HflK [Gammaproteobacteria bacterium]
MGWDDGDKNNPWRSGGNKGPADLDAVVRDFQRRLAGLFGGRRGGGGGPRTGGPPFSKGLIGTALFLLLALWAMTGIYMVDAAEQGIVLRFGAYHATTPPGLRWHLPWPIERVEKINVGATERFTYQGSMLTRDENIVVIDLVVQYRRTEPRAFLFNMRDPERTLRDVTASAIREVIGKNALDFILTEGRAEVAAQTQDLLQATLDSYGAGITVYEVNLQEANFPPEVEVAVQDAIKAREDRERRILEAQEYANQILPLARGEAEKRRQEAEAYRAQVIANAQGEADRFLQILEEYTRAPEVTRERLYLETVEQILAGSTKILVDTDGNNLLYLPLDQLQERRRAVPSSDPAAVGSVPLTSNAPSGRNPREREAR